jgi:hypothetical protein
MPRQRKRSSTFPTPFICFAHKTTSFHTRNATYARTSQSNRGLGRLSRRPSRLTRASRAVTTVRLRSQRQKSTTLSQGGTCRPAPRGTRGMRLALGRPDSSKFFEAFIRQNLPAKLDLDFWAGVHVMDLLSTQPGDLTKTTSMKTTDSIARTPTAE